MPQPPSNLPFAPSGAQDQDQELNDMLADIRPDTANMPPPPVSSRPSQPQPAAEIRSMPEVRTNTPVAPTKPTDDMFAGLDQSPKAPSAKPTTVLSGPATAGHGGERSLIIGLVAAILILATGVGVWYFWSRPATPSAVTETGNVVPPPVSDAPAPSFVPENSVANVEGNSSGVPINIDANTAASETPFDPTIPLAAPVTTPPAGTTVPPPIAIDAEPIVNTPSVSLDTDKDGLTDSREVELGTNQNLADSDQDELSDGDEVVVYGTNPLDRDTDRDGYADGAEVKNGYSPIGSEKCAKPDCRP